MLELELIVKTCIFLVLQVSVDRSMHLGIDRLNAEKIAVSLHSTVEDIMEYNNLIDTNLTVGQIIIVPVRATWNNDTIRKILSDETYIGTLVQGKVEGISYKDKHQIAIPKEKWIRVPHCHNAIIDKETWEIVSARFKNRGRTKTTSTINFLLNK